MRREGGKDMERGADFEMQAEVSRALSEPSFWGEEAGSVDIIETHIAKVFLVGDRAFKMKKSVGLGYLDFRTLQARHAMLCRELELNGPVAPGLYRRVRPVTRDTRGRLRLDGAGPAVEWLLEMKRFDQADLLANRAARGALPETLAQPLGAVVAGLHARAPRCRDEGWADAAERVIRSNASHLAADRSGGVPTLKLDLLIDRTDSALRTHWGCLEERAQRGFVRHCHGDLHLANLILMDERPVPFDCIEFNDEIACQDVLYDLTFLLMDLRFRRMTVFANRVMNAYLSALALGDFEAALSGLPLLPLYAAMRAAIRAHVTLQTRQDMDPGPKSQEMGVAALRYVDLALHVLETPQPRLIAVGGLSGSGKSTLSRDLAPFLGGLAGAVILRSDEVRKRLYGISMTDHLPNEAYAPSISIMIYHILEEEARAALRAGSSVVIDAVFARPDQRLAAAQVGASLGVPFHGFWLDADAETMAQRIAKRRNDASDATVEVMERQLSFDLGRIDWTHLNGSRDRTLVLSEALEILRGQEDEFLEDPDGVLSARPSDDPQGS